MKLIQLNIWQGRFIDQVVAFLRAEQPDIMCLQEVYSSDLRTPVLPFFAGLEHIKQAFPDYHVFFAPTQDMQVLGHTVSLGNAIVSRFPLEDTKTTFIYNQYGSFSKPDDTMMNIRNLQTAMVRVGERALRVANHHGYWEPNATGSEVTVEAMQKVADVLTKMERPLILTGDFNINSASPAMKPIQAQLQDLTQEYSLETTLSSFGKVKNVACDHICVSDDIDVQSFITSEALVSDHLALVLTFGLK